MKNDWRAMTAAEAEVMKQETLKRAHDLKIVEKIFTVFNNGDIDWGDGVEQEDKRKSVIFGPVSKAISGYGAIMLLQKRSRAGLPDDYTVAVASADNYTDRYFLAYFTHQKWALWFISIKVCRLGKWVEGLEAQHDETLARALKKDVIDTWKRFRPVED